MIVNVVMSNSHFRRLVLFLSFEGTAVLKGNWVCSHENNIITGILIATLSNTTLSNCTRFLYSAANTIQTAQLSVGLAK